MAQPPGTPRTIGRKVTEFMAAGEQLRALRTDLRQLLFADEEVPVQRVARREASESEDEHAATSSANRGPGQVRFDAKQRPSSTQQPEKSILKSGTPSLVQQPDESTEADDSDASSADKDKTTVLCSDESETEAEPELTDLEEQLQEAYLKGQSKVCKWWEVIETTKKLLAPACRKKIKGTEKYVFLCPRPACTEQFKQWGEIFDHYLKAHFDSHQGKEMKPLRCPASRCSSSFDTLMGFFCHFVKDHPKSNQNAVLVLIYQENEILPA